MRSPISLQMLLISLLVGGYPTAQLAQANQPVSVSQLRWQSFASRQGGFTVLMPTAPVEGRQTQSTSIGPIDLYSFTAVSENGNVAYLVLYSDFPKDLVRQVDSKVLLNGARDGVANDKKSKLLGERNVYLGRYPGKELRLEGPGGVTAKHRMYMVKQRLYQVIAVTPKARERFLSRDIDNFLRSFRLL